MTTLIIILTMLVLLFLKGFFSGSEIALVNADKMHLTHLANHGHSGAALVLLLFLRTFRPTVIVAFVIVVAIVASLVYYVAAG